MFGFRSFSRSRARAGGVWSPAETAGRLVELSGPARTTLAFSLILAAQEKREPVAFVRTGSASLFFPPDAAGSGVDLAQLPVITVENAACAARAADLLLRSGAFGLVVLDFDGDCELPMALQSRLVGLAHKHAATVLCLTKKAASSASLSSLVSLRAEARHARPSPIVPGVAANADGADDSSEGRVRCGVEVTKDKHRGPGWTHDEVLRGPPGLR